MTASTLTTAAGIAPAVLPHFNLNEIKMEHTRWFWKNRVPSEEVTILQGDPGVGKGHIAVELARHTTTGEPLEPDGERGEIGRVLWFTTEDDPSRALKPRLAAAGADISLVTAPKDADTIRFPSGVSKLSALITTKNAEDPAHPIRLLVIDPISEFADSHIDLSLPQKARPVILALTAVARKFHLVVLVIHHLNKTSSASRQSALHRGSGSVSGLAGAARAVFMVAPDPKDPTQSIFAHVKHNLGPRTSSLAFQILETAVSENGEDFKTSKLVWTGASAVHADELASPFESNRAERNEAEAFLLEFLKEGPRTVADIKTECEERGLSFGGAVRRASYKLEVKKRWNKDQELNAEARSFYVWILPLIHRGVS